VAAVPDPLRLAVGEVYDSGIQRWPGKELILTTEGCIVLVDYIAPAPGQIREFQTAQPCFAWVDTRHNGILRYRFGASPWMMMPFNPHRDTPRDKTPGMPDVAVGRSLPIVIGLADCESPVLAVRTVQWPEHFVDTVGATARRLTAQPFDAEMTVNEYNCLYLDGGADRLVQRASSSIRAGATS
jgi:hypothetical protein